MPQVTLVFSNEAERVITDGDPVYHTAFIRQYLQTHDDTQNPIINLPPFIREDIFDLLQEHLVHNTQYGHVRKGRVWKISYVYICRVVFTTNGLCILVSATEQSVGSPDGTIA